METILALDSLSLSWCVGRKDLQEVLKLRKICFPNARGVLSETDLSGRHLIVRNSEGLLVGSYRVTLSSDINRFESEDDFTLSELLKKSGMKAELAWACVHPDYRDGRVIAILWRGLSEFFKTHRVRYVFGLASISSEGAGALLDIIHYLKGHNFVLNRELIQARHGFFSEKTLVMESTRPPLSKRLLPGLLRAYLMAGAMVCLQPVFDADLDCYDFMTVLDVDNAASPVLTHFKFNK